MASTASTKACLGGMEQRSLGEGRVMMDASRVVALFGAMAASTAGLTRSFVDPCLEDGFAEDGGGNF